ncbi:MAG: hypothetical protein KHY39_13275 [Clostridiaceae bacterium]|nr:hypothetical protein [Clostridiaceae bacterium]
MSNETERIVWYDVSKQLPVHGQAFSELKMPYDIVVAADFADLECEASANSLLFAQRVNSNSKQ